MKVLMLHRGIDVPSARIRMLDLAPHLEALGVECRAVPHPPNARALRALVHTAERPDVFVLQKKLPSPADAWAWRGRPSPLVFDYDDAVMFRQWPRRGSHDSRTRRRRFDRVLRMADAFVCGNAYLASFAEPVAKPVLVAPSPVGLDVPAARGRAPAAPVRLGWLGSPENLPSLASLGPALRALSAERRFELVVVSRERLDLPGVAVRHVPWTLDAQEREIAAFDIGLMPLVDSPFSRGKCAYKLLQYMAAAVPVVASPVGVNAEIVVDGRNGLLAGAEQEWTSALARLIDAPDLAERLGRAGRETAASGYGYPLVASQWKRFLDALCGG